MRREVSYIRLYLHINTDIPLTNKLLKWHKMETPSGRRAPRYPLAVDVELTNLESGIQIKERTKDLSL